MLTRDMLLGAVRSALYSPALAAALPEAIEAAVARRFRRPGRPERDLRFAQGDAARHRHAPVRRLRRGRAAPGARATRRARLRHRFRARYERLCAAWPRGAVPAAFYSHAASPSPVLVLSGGIDPATPPRHGERVAHALGPLARHVVVANAGHGVLGIGCMRDVVYRFVDAATTRCAGASTPAAPPACRGRRRSCRLGRTRRPRSRPMIEVAASPSRSPPPRRRGPAGSGSVAPPLGRDSSRRRRTRARGARRQLRAPTAARSPACSAPTAPARRRRCACLRGSSRPSRDARGRRHRRRDAAARGAGADGRAFRRARPLSAADGAREHRLLRRAAGHGARRRRCARPGPGAHVRHDGAARPPQPRASARASG